MERLTVKEPTMGYYYSGYSTSDIINRLAYYEDLEEQGLLLKLPCKVGTPIYYVGSRINDELFEWEYFVGEYGFGAGMLDEWGEKFFLTKKEAEEALRKKVE